MDYRGYLTSGEPASIESETALKLKASGLAKVESAVIKQINQPTLSLSVTT